MQSMTTVWAALCLAMTMTISPVWAEEVVQGIGEDLAETGESIEAAATSAETTAEEVAVEDAGESAEAVDPFAQMMSASHEDISYSIGYTLGADMVQRGAEFDPEELIAGLRAGLSQGETRLTQEQMAQCLFSFQMQMQQEMLQQQQAQIEKNMAYLTENGQKEGVTTTASGLQYRVIQAGDGASPTLQDKVYANYRGTLLDGTEFDRSPEGQPVDFALNEVIPGWIEALQLMKVGDKWELTLPSNLAYGERGHPSGTIGPNEILIFEIELVKIESP